MFSSALIIFSTVAIAATLFLPKVANNRFWRATVTPLASIIGSGFLILGPILEKAYGGYSPLVMAVLCVVAILFGSAIRFNIRHTDRRESNRATMMLEDVSSWVLAFAYVISVAYYLNLFGAFGVRLTSVESAASAKLLTSGIFVLILVVGWTRGFSALERMEQFTVSLKLSIIAGLIVGLALFAGDHVLNNQLVFDPAVTKGWAAVTLAFGLIVTIQGFETSRYLGEEYDAKTRIGSMRFAQYISSGIYVVYILLLAYVFKPGDFKLSETAIIDMMEVVAPVLPVLLIAAALSAQFSAAVADTEGSGGLIFELTHGRVKTSYAYGILVAAGLGLTWSANVFEIVSFASRAFALYYAIQAAIAARTAFDVPGKKVFGFGYAMLALLGFAIAVFGTSVE